MSPELIAFVAVGFVSLGLILSCFSKSSMDSADEEMMRRLDEMYGEDDNE